MARPTAPVISIARRGSSDGDVDCTVVWVRGDHDIATRVSLAVAIVRAGQLDHADLVVDLSGVTFMDASTIGALVGCSNRLREHSQSLAVRAPSPRALRVLELCGLVSLVLPAALPGVHPTGVAAALSTWVEVPSTGPAPAGGRGGASDAPRKVRQVRGATLAATELEADHRGGP